jgi:uncharacterized membrane protein
VNKDEFLRHMRRNLKGLSPSEIEEIIADYRAHFAEASADGRSEEATAQALGNPGKLAREHLTDAHYHAWHERHNPLSLLKWLLVSMGAVFLLPFVGVLLLFLPFILIFLLTLLIGAVIGGGLLLTSLMPALLAVAIVVGVLVVIAKSAARLRRHQVSVSAHDEQLIERILPWTPGASMGISLPAEVHWRPAQQARACIRGTARQIEHITLEDLQLRGKFKWKLFRPHTIRVELEGPAIGEWAIAGSGDLFLHELSQDVLSLKIAGSGDVVVTGAVQTLNIDIAGSGDVDAGKLQQRRTTVRIAGHGDASIAPTESADLTIVGSGDITVYGQPEQITRNIIGAGDIRMVDGQHSA